MKLCIVGSRDFTDYKLLRATIDRLNLDITEIVSGGARGADELAERYASEKGIKLKVFSADWNTHGKAAGPIRNRQMLEYIKQNNGECIAFWDGQSKGTKNDIDLCDELDIPIEVMRV